MERRAVPNGGTGPAERRPDAAAREPRAAGGRALPARTWAVPVATAFVLGLLLMGGVPSVATGTSSYSVRFTEAGLAPHTNWSVSLGNRTIASTSPTIVFGGVAAGSARWSVVTPLAGAIAGTRFITRVSSGSVDVPFQLAQTVAFAAQFEVKTTTQPRASAVIAPATPFWVARGSVVVLYADPLAGFAMGNWTPGPNATVVASAGSSVALRVDGPVNATAHLSLIPYRLTFDETGLPSGTRWSVIYNGSFLTTSSSSITIPTTYGARPWNIFGVSGSGGAQYVPVNSTGIAITPFQTAVAVVFRAQYQVSFLANPFNRGSTSPSTATAYTNGSVVPILARPLTTSDVFVRWSTSSITLAVANATDASTALTVHGAGTVTATFTNGTSCTSCTVVFKEVGLPLAKGGHVLAWGVTLNQTLVGSRSTSLRYGPVSSGFNGCWSALSPIPVPGHPGIEYVASTASGCLALPLETEQVVIYQEEARLSIDPTGVPPGTQLQPTAGFYPVGQPLPLQVIATPGTTFRSWTATPASALNLSSRSSSGATLTLNGSGTLGLRFNVLHPVARFVEVGLPTGTSWLVQVAGFGNFTSPGREIEVRGLPASVVRWSVPAPLSNGVPGVRYVANGTIPSLDLTAAPSIIVVFATQYWVSFRASGASGGSVSPSASGFYPAGSHVPVAAINGSAATFSNWTASSSRLKVLGPSQAATWIVVRGPGTVTATFR
jgi:hypothetical protein